MKGTESRAQLEWDKEGDKEKYLYCIYKVNIPIYPPEYIYFIT